MPSFKEHLRGRAYFGAKLIILFDFKPAFAKKV